MTRKAPRIVVVGAGIIGAAFTYRLARAGARPLLIEAGSGGGVTTPTSWAWLNASWGNPEPYVRLRRRSIAEWHVLASEVTHLPVSFPGSLTYDLTPAEMATYVERYGGWGYRLRRLDAAAIRRREPALRAVPEAAVLCEEEGVAEPVASARRLREAAIDLGAGFLPASEVLGFARTGERVTGVLTSAGRHDADAVVCAAGIASPGLLAKVGYHLPFATPEGLLAHTQVLPRRLEGLLIMPELHVRQTLEGRLVAGFDFVGNIVEAPERAAARLVASMNERLDLPEPARLDFTTLGRRPTPGDGFPAVGWVPGAPGLYLAVMHSGMTLAAAIGLIGAGEVLGAEPDPLLAPYRPERFLPGRSAA